MNNFNGIKSKLERAKELDGVLRQKSMERMNYCKHEFRKKLIQQQSQRLQLNETGFEALYNNLDAFMERKREKAKNSMVEPLLNKFCPEIKIVSPRVVLGKNWQKFLTCSEKNKNKNKLTPPFLMARRPRIVLDGILEGYCAGMDGTTGGNWPVDGFWSYQFEKFGRAVDLKSNNNTINNIRNPAEFNILVKLLEKKKCDIEKEMRSPIVLNKLISHAKKIISTEDTDRNINHKLNSTLKVLDVGCGKGRWLGMASTNLRKEIETNLSTLYCVLVENIVEDEQQQRCKWKIQDFTWGEGAKNAKKNAEEDKMKITIQVDISWFPSRKMPSNNDKKTFLWHGITGGNKLFSDGGNNARLLDPSCNTILYDYGTMCGKDALVLGLKQAETRLRKDLQQKKERIAMIKEDLSKHRNNGFHELQAEKSARLVWNINRNLDNRIYGGKKKEKTKEEKNLEDCAWNVYRKAKEEEGIQKELMELEYSSATVLQWVPFEMPSSIPIEPIFQQGKVCQNNCYDLIVSSWTFRHLSDPLGSLEFYANLLSRGGEMYINGFMMNVVEPGNNILISEEVYEEDMNEAIPKIFCNDLCDLCMSDIIPGNEIDTMLAEDECMELGLILITERPSTKLDCKEEQQQEEEGNLKKKEDENKSVKYVKESCNKTRSNIVENVNVKEQLQNISERDILAKARATVNESAGLLANSILDLSYPSKQVYATADKDKKEGKKRLMIKKSIKIYGGKKCQMVKRRESKDVKMLKEKVL